ncbi:MAG: hypothetical protein HY665_03310 [Chloroflexi bacterium]|nr:hypothetical protein [Chloroflexota bacterium]
METRPLRAVLKRETLHFTAGTGVGVALFFLPWPAALIVLAAAAAFMVIFEVVRFAFPSLNRRFMVWFSFIVRQGEKSKVTGSTYFLIGALATALVFPKHITVPAVMFLALGDPMGSVIGVWKGRTKLWGKSLEGHLACLAACLVVGVLLANAFPELSLTVAVAGAVAATVFQAFDLPINDNITIALGSAIVMRVVAFLEVL